ncbi:MAG: hypothetical protein WCX17_01180 [Parcubacteria group bacterium]
MEKYLKKYYRLFFLAVAVLLLYPTLQRGYIFLLDWMVEPNIAFSDINLLSDSIGWITYKFLAIVFSFAVFQKILLFAIVYFLGLAGFRLAKRTRNIYAQYFAGLFFIFNPFIYARLVEQINVIVGSVLFLWFLVYFLEYLEEDVLKKLVWSAILAALAISFFPHCAFLVAATFLVLVISNFISKKDWKLIFKTALIFGAIVISLNSNWLFSFSQNRGDLAVVENFSQADWKSFETSSIGGDSVYTTVLALQGYWGEYQDRFVSIRENPLWSPAFLLIFALSVFGAIKLWKKDPHAKPLIFLFFIAYILAIGISSPITKPLSVFLYNYLPFYTGLREPQKWVIVLVFVYAYLGGWGIKYLLETKKFKDYRTEIGIFCAILPIIFSFSAIQGMREHFTPQEFPVEWQGAKNFLKENPTDGKILFLPWHSYMEFSFAGKNIINPAQSFFGKNIIVGNNTEFGPVYSHYSDPRTLAIEKYMPRKNNPSEKINYADFISDMEKFKIQKIILAKDEDWQKYAWLDTIQTTKVLENNKLKIYDLQ